MEDDICKQEITVCVRGDRVMWIQTESGKHYEAYGRYVVKGMWYPADDQTVWTPLEKEEKPVVEKSRKEKIKDALEAIYDRIIDDFIIERFFLYTFAVALITLVVKAITKI